MKGTTTIIPTRKVGASAAVGALTVVLVWIIGALGVTVPAEVAAALTTILTFGAGYFVSENDL